MIVYHGSMHCFKKLRIGKALVDKRSTMDNEGYGIYFSTDRRTAETYGKYLYTLEIDEDYFKDFRNIDVCKAYVNDLTKYIKKKTGINLSKYVRLYDTVKRIRYGGLAISGVGREISLLLDSNENFYNDLSESKRNRLFQILRAYDKKHLDVYMFTYHIPNIGVIKNLNPDVVKIISREKRY